MRIDAPTLAEISDKTVRHARRWLSEGIIDGHPIEVRDLPAAGGMQKVARVSSLPSAHQQRYRELDADPIDPLTLRADAAGLAEHNWKVDVIRPVLAHERGTVERADELRRLVGTTRIDWTGRPQKLSRAALYKWIKIYETSGGRHLCLAKRVRRDKGQPRVFIGQAWDAAVRFDAETCQQIRETLKQYVRGLIAGGGGRKHVLLLAGEKLKEISLAYGYRGPLDDGAFTVPLDFYREETHYQVLYRHKSDRKASEDARPRIRRTIEGLRPMDVVVADVHHMNVLLRREDGSTATPKLLAFHDIATQRVFCEIILFEGRGAVRNADIITAFVNMCQDPAFGVPRTLYVDNGSEYRFADALADALLLSCDVIPFGRDARGHPIIRSKPYNAAAKQVEGWFRHMNQLYFRHIPGWIDDDRMNPKGPELGKTHPPFPGDFDGFCDTVLGFLTAYDNIAQDGALRGKSPAATFRQHVDAGWTATLMSPADLLTVFTEAAQREVRQHGIQVKGQVWTGDALTTYLGARVIAYIPKWHGFSALRVTDLKGKELGIVHADQPYDVLDRRGAQESARRGGLRNRALRDMGKSVPGIDVGRELIGYGQRQAPVIPNTPDAVISVNRPAAQGLALPPTKVSAEPTRQEELEEARVVDAARRASLGLPSQKAS